MEEPSKNQQSGTPQKQNKLKAWWSRGTATPMKLHEKIIGIILVVVILFAFYITLDANKYRALVHVIEGEGRVGVNPTAEALDFGDLSRGTSAVRRVDIQNGTVMPVYIMVFKTGEIASLIKIDQNFFRLAPKSGTKIEFTVYMPASAEIDDSYRGRVFLFKIPTFGL